MDQNITNYEKKNCNNSTSFDININNYKNLSHSLD